MAAKKIVVRKPMRSDINVLRSIETEAVMCSPRTVQSIGTRLKVVLNVSMVSLAALC